MKMKRRYWRTPQAKLDEFERLIRETDLSAEECAGKAGITTGRTGTPRVIVKKHRRYIGNGRWVDCNTGKVRPEICTAACAAEKTGLSLRTISRRKAAQFIGNRKSTSHALLTIFTEDDIAMLNAIGRWAPDAWGKLNRDHVEDIRQRAQAGEMHSAIAQDYPVSRRQISRIVSGERWGKILQTQRSNATPPGARTLETPKPGDTP